MEKLKALTPKPLAKRDRIEVRAVFVGQRINMKALEQTRRVATSPFVMQAGADGYAVLFRYGVVVMFGMNAVEEASFIGDLQEFVINPFETPVSDSCELIIDKKASAEGPDPQCIYLKDTELDKIQLIADIMSKNVVLSHYESLMADTFDAIDPISTELQNGGPSGKRTRELLRHIGLTLAIQRKMVGQVEIEEKPEVLWERSDLERLFAKLEDEYEIKERNSALKQKLDLVYKTAETLLGLLQEKRTLHVEWYIVILIVIEIFITLGEKLFHL